MKKFLLISTIIVVTTSLVALGLFASNFHSYTRLRASGKLLTKTLPIPAFDELRVSRGITVVLTAKASDKMTIEADDNVMDYVTVTTEQNKLSLSIDKSIQNLSNASVTITIPTDGKIDKLDASSAAKIVGKRLLTATDFEIDASSGSSIEVAVKADKCELDASSAAKLDVALEAEDVSVDLSSAAKVNLAGTATRGKVSLSSGAKLSATDLVVENLRVSTSSGAKAAVNCTKTLSASASSGASISYTGDCTVERKTSSGGSVKQH